MKQLRWGLIKEQMAVQLQVRTLNFYSFFLLILQPAVFSIIGMLLSHAAGNALPDLVYSVIGGGIMGMWSGIVFTSTYDIAADRVNGVLELIVGSPTSLADVEAIRTLTNVLAGLGSLLLAFLAAITIFSYDLSDINFWGIAISLLLLLFAMWCAGVFLANFLAWSRISSTFVEYLEMPIAILCGFMYPLRVLPEWMRGISTLLPIRWALEAMNESLLGMQDWGYLVEHWAIAVVQCLLLMGINYLLQKKVQEHIRVSGELSSL